MTRFTLSANAGHSRSMNRLAHCETGGHLPAGLLGRTGSATGTIQVAPGIQSSQAAPGAGERDARGAVSFPRLVWSQASPMAVEVGPEQQRRPALRSPLGWAPVR